MLTDSYPTLIIDNTLRRLCEGSKVCCEIVIMATDAVLIPEGEEIITVACTSIGTDTVMVIKSGASNKFLEIKDLKFLIKTMCYTLIIKVNYE